MKDSRQAEVLLPKLSARIWRLVLDFIYRDEVNLSALPIHYALELYDCADYCQFGKQKGAVREGIGSSMNRHNFCECLLIAFKRKNDMVEYLVQTMSERRSFGFVT